MKITVSKKIIITIISTTLLISAIIYNLLYINNKKNEIIEEIKFEVIPEEVKIEKKLIYIDIGGEVNSPGLYELPEGARVNDAIIMSEGVTENADMTDVNLAYILSDAMKITIPKKEVKTYNYNAQSKVVKKPVISKNINITDSTENNIININTADKAKLKELSGIGDSTADKIIEYRSQVGSFSSVEEIKNVPGIGESKYNTIKEKIEV